MKKNDWTRLLTLLLFGKVSLSIRRSVWIKYANSSNYIRMAGTWNCRKCSSVLEQQFRRTYVRFAQVKISNYGKMAENLLCAMFIRTFKRTSTLRAFSYTIFNRTLEKLNNWSGDKHLCCQFNLKIMLSILWFAALFRDISNMDILLSIRACGSFSCYRLFTFQTRNSAWRHHICDDMVCSNMGPRFSSISGIQNNIYWRQFYIFLSLRV